MSPREKNSKQQNNDLKGKEEEQKGVKNEAPQRPLPALLEISFTIARLLILVVTAVVVLLSLFAGASLWIAILRGGVAVLALGLILWFINWLLVHYALKNWIAEMNAKQADKEIGFHTMERQA